MPAEDLDAIQLELETMLSIVALRYRGLKNEYDVLDKAADEKREKKGKLAERQPSSPGKRKRHDEKPLKKELKQSGGGSGTVQSKMSKIKSNPIPSPCTDDSMDALLIKDNPKLMFHRNDLPNKFWLSVEPYCMPLTNEDMRLLDDLLEEYSGVGIPPIPDLGPHYSSVWASEDLKEEHDIAKGKGKSCGFNFMKRSEKIMCVH